MKCLQCGSTDIVRSVRPVDRGHNDFKRTLELVVYRDPNALIFKGAEKFPLSANVCADRGYVMFNVHPDDAKFMKQIQEED